MITLTDVTGFFRFRFYKPSVIGFTFSPTEYDKLIEDYCFRRNQWD